MPCKRGTAQSSTQHSCTSHPSTAEPKPEDESTGSTAMQLSQLPSSPPRAPIPTSVCPDGLRGPGAALLAVSPLLCNALRAQELLGSGTECSRDTHPAAWLPRRAGRALDASWTLKCREERERKKCHQEKARQMDPVLVRAAALWYLHGHPHLISSPAMSVAGEQLGLRAAPSTHLHVPSPPPSSHTHLRSHFSSFALQSSTAWGSLWTQKRIHCILPQQREDPKLVKEEASMQVITESIRCASIALSLTMGPGRPVRPIGPAGPLSANCNRKRTIALVVSLLCYNGTKLPSCHELHYAFFPLPGKHKSLQQFPPSQRIYPRVMPINSFLHPQMGQAHGHM